MALPVPWEARPASGRTAGKGRGTLVPWVTRDPKMQWEESWGWGLFRALIPDSATYKSSVSVKHPSVNTTDPAPPQGLDELTFIKQR